MSLFNMWLTFNYFRFMTFYGLNDHLNQSENDLLVASLIRIIILILLKVFVQVM